MVTNDRTVLTRVTFALFVAAGIAGGLTAQTTAAVEVSCNIAVTTDDNCGGADPRCRMVAVSGTTNAEGDVNIEIDWDDGNGFGENQNIGGPDFNGGWVHSYQDNGLRHIRVEAEDSTGAKCFVEHSEVIEG